MEEYAEAKLFSGWLLSKDSESSILFKEDMSIIDFEEYIGGLCDLTGEVGRVAVAYGTKRDSENVTRCLATNMSILNTLQTVSLPPKLNKKIGALEQSVSKLEQILYEISLIDSKGGGMVQVENVLVEKEEE